MVRVRWVSLIVTIFTGMIINGSGEESTSPATEATREAHRAVLETLPFSDRQAFADVQRGFIAPLYQGGVIHNAEGRAVYEPHNFSYPLDAPAPETVNPSLWRQTQLNGVSGLFKVVDGIFQVRGQDVSNLTIIEGETGIIVMDPLSTAQAAELAMELYYSHRPRKPVVAVIYTHSHTDHYGGVSGVVNHDDAASGKVRIIAPTGFMEEAIRENILLGNAMLRRATYMYGRFVPQNASGNVGTGLGVGVSVGNVTLIPPTEEITATGQRLTIDGLEFEFLLAPESEAPAEMHFYIPSLKALCTAENCVHTMHNTYTLRGAQTRDTLKWVGYLNETLDRWGDEVEVLFAPHSWPVWGNDRIAEHIEKYRDVFKFTHDQTLHLANKGYTMNEIGATLRLPDALDRNWSTRGYYGSLSHNARAVYNFYLGYFDGNPANLDPFTPVEMGTRYVAAMGGADAVLEKAVEAFGNGDYRWTAELLKNLIYAQPDHREARLLQASAFEQMGYQIECASWRGFYLSGARDLRLGIQRPPPGGWASSSVFASMSVEMLLDYLAVRLDGVRSAEKEIQINFIFPEPDDVLQLTLRNGVLNYRRTPVVAPDLEVRLTRQDLFETLTGRVRLADLVKDGKAVKKGEIDKLDELFQCLDTFDQWFELVVSNMPR